MSTNTGSRFSSSSRYFDNFQTCVYSRLDQAPWSGRPRPRVLLSTNFDVLKTLANVARTNYRIRLLAFDSSAHRRGKLASYSKQYARTSKANIHSAFRLLTIAKGLKSRYQQHNLHELERRKETLENGKHFGAKSRGSRRRLDAAKFERETCFRYGEFPPVLKSVTFIASETPGRVGHVHLVRVKLEWPPGI